MKIAISRITADKINVVYQFIKQFPLNYPDYNGWVEKCKRELRQGIKTGFYAYADGKIVGVIIFQTHKTSNSIIEIKNFRVADEYQGKGIGSRLYEQTENYSRERKFSAIQVDSHNPKIIRFFKAKGFKIKERKPLYKKGRLETILIMEI